MQFELSLKFSLRGLGSVQSEVHNMVLCIYVCIYVFLCIFDIIHIIQCSTIQDSAVQYNTVQYNTVFIWLQHAVTFLLGEILLIGRREQNLGWHHYQHMDLVIWKLAQDLEWVEPWHCGWSLKKNWLSQLVNNKAAPKTRLPLRRWL